jgi:predicted transcriptional regulator
MPWCKHLNIDHGLEVMLEKGPKKLQILGILAQSKEAVGSEELSKVSNMSESNVIRIVNELEKKQAVKCVTGRKRDRRFEITRKGRFHLSLIEGR